MKELEYYFGVHHPKNLGITTVVLVLFYLIRAQTWFDQLFGGGYGTEYSFDMLFGTYLIWTPFFQVPLHALITPIVLCVSVYVVLKSSTGNPNLWNRFLLIAGLQVIVFSVSDYLMYGFTFLFDNIFGAVSFLLTLVLFHKLKKTVPSVFGRFVLAFIIGLFLLSFLLSALRYGAYIHFPSMLIRFISFLFAASFAGALFQHAQDKYEGSSIEGEVTDEELLG